MDEPEELPTLVATASHPPGDNPTCREHALSDLCRWSAFAGVAARTLVQPLDTIRARVMVSSRPLSVWQTIEQAGTVPHKQRTWRCTTLLRSLYRGYSISVLVQAPAVATYLTVYEKTKSALSQWTASYRAAQQQPPLDLSSASPWNHLFSGLAAESVSAVFWTPMEVLKQRAQVAASDADASLRVLTRRTWAEEGAHAFFRGYLLTIGVFGPYAMIYFVTYERLKRWWSSVLSRTGPLPSWSVLTSAAISGAVAAALTTPLDVLKTRLQTSRLLAGEHLSAWGLASQLVQRQGSRVLFRGLGPRILWVMPNTAITMTVFEYFKARAESRTAPIPPSEGAAQSNRCFTDR
ncbi:hypothetical protein F1559_004345 [Cyanidiococcus yangmingshanensis]|uniref:Uncharacterized protein n=1 Tax=Cyanidiococcus yangmingshanensis TaxID=2690220 RepID=A0A7J7IN67_9RHOD|nr:hypothetical protein F1559_004345 [Cyanidiococcus yangmingshanensis]